MCFDNWLFVLNRESQVSQIYLPGATKSHKEIGEDDQVTSGAAVEGGGGGTCIIKGI